MKTSVNRKANQTEKNIPPKSLLEAFLSNVEKNPDSPAVIHDNGVMTYKETMERAAVLAESLKKAGMKTGDRVAVSLSRGAELVCAVLGILGAGGAYVPVSCTQPEERRRSIYKQADIKFCLTYSSSSAIKVTECCNILTDRIENNSVSQNFYIAFPDETAYIIFTSGSTGLPKGVEISHAGAWNTIADVLDRFEIDSSDRAIAVSAIDFDLSVFDIFGMLSAGGAVAVLTEKTQKEPSAWVKVIKEADISIWNSVPALLEMLLLSLKNDEKLSSLKKVLISGDKIRPELYGMLKAHTDNCRFIALGGATEASIWSNFYEVTAVEDSWIMIPYGKPLANQKFRIMTKHGDADDNEIGELWIGGEGLAKGYISQPELTENSFIYDNGERWYKTGDLGYYLHDDTIMFYGRKDNQLKINGFRIETGEIEKHISSLEQAEQAFVLVDESETGKSLCAVIKTSAKTDTEEIPSVSSVIADPESEQDCIIADFMKYVLYEDEELFFTTDELSGNGKDIVSLWQKFLSTVKKSDTYEIPESLKRKKGLLRSIIAGEINPTALLDDDILAPAKLMQTPQTEIIVKNIAKAVRLKAEQTEEKFRLVLLFGRDGDIFLPLMQELSDIAEKLQIIFMETSSAMIQNAQKKYASFRLNVEYRRTNYFYLSADEAGTADVVIAVNGLHMFKNISLGLDWIKLFMKKGGILYAVEPEKMTALGLISAGVIEHGFTDYEKIRKNSSMMPPESWKKSFVNAGFENINIQESEVGGFYEYICESADNAFPDEKLLKAYCSEKLVPYMIPEHFCYATSIPLTANGKIDKKLMLKWFKSETSRKGTIPQTETQKKVSDVWNGFFNLQIIYLEDNFFEIGGDSLIAVRMLNNLGNIFGISVSMREFFDNPTLKQLSEVIDNITMDSDMEEGEL